MRLALAAFAVLLAAGLTGCAEEPTDDPTVGTPTSVSGLPEDYEVPAVTDPLDPAPFAADPCALLTASQREGFGLPDTERQELAGDVECLLHPAGDTVTSVQLRLMTDRGLADLVAQCRTDNAPAACATWAPAEVETYPAVLDTGGQCRLMVGIAERAVLLVNDVAESKCPRATDIATAALTTLREGP